MHSPLQPLQDRYASKSFTKDQHLSQENIDMILESANLAPTSFGLQPFKIIEVSNQSIKEQLAEAAGNQVQFTECDRVLIWAVEKDLELALDKYQDRIISSNRLNEEKTQKFLGYINSHLDKHTVLRHASVFNWSAKQAYLSLGFALYTCAILNIASCPMEGFDPDKVDTILGLAELGLQSSVILTIGVENPTDSNKTQPKVRKSLEELVIKL
jgi:nitroreductase / dihydropteridine reductase